jgi:transcriptional regulator with XRE-family HTH domain
MIATTVVKEIERLLHDEKLSQRKVALLMGVSRGTIGTIAAGRRPDYEQLRLDRADKLPKPEGPSHRCPRCGALVQLPCMACHIRSLTTSGQTIGRFTGGEPLLELELRGKHRQRYEEVHRERELADARAEVETAPDAFDVDDNYELNPADVLDAFEAEDEDVAVCQSL